LNRGFDNRLSGVVLDPEHMTGLHDHRDVESPRPITRQEARRLPLLAREVGTPSERLRATLSSSDV
jgi:hypothetical protein